MEEVIYYPDPRYPTFQHAVDALLPGGQLVVLDGEHVAGVTVGKKVDIISDDGHEAILHAPIAEGRVISLVAGAELHLQEVTLSGGRAGLIACADAQAAVTNCSFLGSRDGIYTSGLASAVISACYIHENERIGIALDESAVAIIEESTVASNAWDGIRMTCSVQATVSNSTIKANGVGIAIGDYAEATVQGNTIHGNAEAGI